MADIYSVTVALTNLAQQAIYPNGIQEPSIANCDVRIYPGAPLPASLDADLINGIANVSIFPGRSKGTTRFDARWNDTRINEPTLFASFDALTSTVTITGQVEDEQTVMIVVDDIGYAYAVSDDDTLNIIAASLAQAIPGASANQNVITITGAHSIHPHISVSGASSRELARELRDIVISVFAPTPLVRSILSNAIMVLFSASYRLLLPDGYYGQLKFFSSDEIDLHEKVLCYKRDIHFDFEYAITQQLITATVADNIVIVERIFIID